MREAVASARSPGADCSATESSEVSTEAGTDLRRRCRRSSSCACRRAMPKIQATKVAFRGSKRLMFRLASTSVWIIKSSAASACGPSRDARYRLMRGPKEAHSSACAAASACRRPRTSRSTRSVPSRVAAPTASASPIAVLPRSQSAPAGPVWMGYPDDDNAGSRVIPRRDATKKGQETRSCPVFRLGPVSASRLVHRPG